jgi:hypothetical protein|tara:strand:+ start:150 stop:461 length:312 start_codon:yes stop_codon:yes gene_type:complete
MTYLRDGPAWSLSPDTRTVTTTVAALLLSEPVDVPGLANGKASGVTAMTPDRSNCMVRMPKLTPQRADDDRNLLDFRRIRNGYREVGRKLVSKLRAAKWLTSI